MNKILLLILTLLVVGVSGCSVTTSKYYPGYTNDYVYSVGYYGYRPYWGSRYYGYYNSVYWNSYYRPAYFGSYYPRAWYGYVSRW